MSRSPRRRRIIRSLLHVGVIAVLAPAGWVAWRVSGVSPPPKTHRLPSGRVLHVFYAEVVGDDEWLLEYHTRLPLSRELLLAHERGPVPVELAPELRVLHCEAESLRADVQQEAQKAGVRKASIQPTSTAWKRVDGLFPWHRGGISVGRALEFTLTQAEDGTWRKTAGWASHSCERWD